MGEGEVTSPPLYMTEAEIEAELQTMARLASQGVEQTSSVQKDDLAETQLPNGSVRPYKHSSVAILASTVPDEDAASEGKPTPRVKSDKRSWERAEFVSWTSCGT